MPAAGGDSNPQDPFGGLLLQLREIVEQLSLQHYQEVGALKKDGLVSTGSEGKSKVNIQVADIDSWFISEGNHSEGASHNLGEYTPTATDTRSLAFANFYSSIDQSIETRSLAINESLAASMHRSTSEASESRSVAIPEFGPNGIDGIVLDEKEICGCRMVEDTKVEIIEVMIEDPSPPERDASTVITPSMPFSEVSNLSSSNERRFLCRGAWLADVEPLVESEQSGQRRRTRRSTTTSYTQYEAVCCVMQACVVVPNDARRVKWLLLSAVFLLYDIFTIPFVFGFQFNHPGWMPALKFIINVYWTSDIVFTFFTGRVTSFGHLEMNIARIAVKYLRKEFCLDLILVVLDWVMWQFSKIGHSPFSVLRWARIMRLIRLVRSWRISSLSKVLRKCALRTGITEGVLDIVSISFSSLFGLLLTTHVLACFWHFIGYNLHDGWVERLEMDEQRVRWRYAFTMMWTMNRMQGLSTVSMQDAPFLEIGFEGGLVFISCVIVTVFISRVNTAAMSWSVLNHQYELKQIADEFSWRHRLSDELRDRVMKFFDASRLGGPQEIVEVEHRLIEKLPDELAYDVLYQAHRPTLCRKQFFHNMSDANPRALRHVCSEALSFFAALKFEIVFSAGDVSHTMLLLRSGSLTYHTKESVERVSTKTDAAKWLYATLSTTEDDDASEERNMFCEVTLWTPWEHVGTLYAEEDAMLMALSATGFSNVITQHQDAYRRACVYAKRFVAMLNHSTVSKLDDLTGFQFTAEECEQEIYTGSELDHFVFISHYKVEAGTEATLVRESIERIIKRDQRHPGHSLKSPVFIDSEDLVDLAQLVAHVEGSRCLLLLLTPGLLSRPWCLLEIVAAFRKGVNILPVEIQRPGIKYQYPDNNFYREFRHGKHLEKEGIRLLEKEGVKLKEIESALRWTFQKIALSFSPHKTKTVRDAEINDILKRCEVKDNAIVQSMTTHRTKTFDNA